VVAIGDGGQASGFDLPVPCARCLNGSARQRETDDCRRSLPVTCRATGETGQGTATAESELDTAKVP
jgi:hypothetical protein